MLLMLSTPVCTAEQSTEMLPYTNTMSQDVSENTAYCYEILDLYNKGIAVGSDEYMTYYPEASVKRCEVAAIVSRIMYTDMRIELPKG